MDKRNTEEYCSPSLIRIGAVTMDRLLMLEPTRIPSTHQTFIESPHSIALRRKHIHSRAVCNDTSPTLFHDKSVFVYGPNDVCLVSITTNNSSKKRSSKFQLSCLPCDYLCTITVGIYMKRLYYCFLLLYF